MKVSIVLVLVGFLALVRAGTYTTKYDNIDLDEILNNQRLYQKYYDCLMDKARCTPDGKELKENLPDALETGCAKCTDRQKAGTRKVIKFLSEHKPADFANLKKKYDPEGKNEKFIRENYELN